MLNSKLKGLVVGLSLAVLSGIAVQAATYRSAFSLGLNDSNTEFVKSSNLPASNFYPSQKLLSADAVASTVLPTATPSPAVAATPKADQKPAVSVAKAIPKPITRAVQKINGVILYTAADLDLLARLIEAEAQGESYTAKVAVAGVVINRVQSSTFPNNLHDVIYQRINGYYQFTPVLNGWINKPASQESINAANAALHGSDPSNGALFYFDNSVTNPWLWSKKIATKIDSLVFSY